MYLFLLQYTFQKKSQEETKRKPGKDIFIYISFESDEIFYYERDMHIAPRYGDTWTFQNFGRQIFGSLVVRGRRLGNWDTIIQVFACLPLH